MERKELTVELPCRSSGQAKTENCNKESMNYRIEQMAAEAWGKGKEDRMPGLMDVSYGDGGMFCTNISVVRKTQ